MFDASQYTAWDPVRERDGIGPRGVRHDYVHDNVRFKVASAGRRSTKTLHAKRILVRKLPYHLTIPREQRPPWWNKPWRYFYGAPVQDQANDIAFDDLKELIPAWWIKRIYRGKKPVFKTIFNSEIHILGMDEARRFEGHPWNGGVLDEFPDMAEDVFESTIVPVLADRKAWLIILGVPDYAKPNNDMFRKLFDKGNDPNEPDYKSYTWPSRDVLEEADIEMMRGTMSPILFRQETEASWETAPGRAYQEFSYNVHVRKEARYSSLYPILVSCDFNRQFHNWGLYQYSDTHGLYSPSLTTGYGENMYVAFDEVFGQDATVEKMCMILDDKLTALGHHGELWFFGDHSGDAQKAEATDSAWSQIRKHFAVRPMKPQFLYEPQGAIADRVEAANAWLRNASNVARTIINPQCLNLIRDFEKVPLKLLYSNKKTAELSHASDNYGYLVVQHSRTEQTKRHGAQVSARIRRHTWTR